MNNSAIIDLTYIVAAVLFIYGIKMLGKAATAQKGNLVSAVGMLIAVLATLIQSGLDYQWIFIGLIVGSAIGTFAAIRVQMTSMPEMVALFNGFGGLASLLVGWAEIEKINRMEWVAYITETQSNASFVMFVICLTILIGGITFTGSILAYGKLSEKISGSAIVFPGQKLINALIFVIIIAGTIVLTVDPSNPNAYAIIIGIIVLSNVLGILGVLPIGGGDMPVVISLLNSFSGVAASIAGFIIANKVLIVAGCLVGASGLVLTVIMCKAMNRKLTNVLFSGFGSSAQKSTKVQGEMKAMSIEEAYYVLEAARSVVIIPGYGMAVAQAQHVVKELGTILENNGCEVRYAIHPVAGRMPGHMNVLLAEADVPYEQLCESDAVNATMDLVDVAIVIGANDVVNPAALDDPNSPIYGMPIVEAHRARTVFALKRGAGAGFSGLINTLYFAEKTRMLYGDAKGTVSALVAEFKEK
jgi:NAD(P) transhydrogenase subunit beta